MQLFSKPYFIFNRLYNACIVTVSTMRAYETKIQLKKLLKYKFIYSNNSINYKIR